MRNIYFIGGSPCSGKSTMAEIIAQKFNLHYFKVDDYIDEYTVKGAASGKSICMKLKNMTPEQIWMRDPKNQSMEEIQFYQEIFEFIIEDINNITYQNGIITEGAAFLPCIMKNRDIDQKHYINITPSPEFQISHFRERPFVPYVLEGCSDKEKAFMKWMDRDILFAKAVREQAMEMGYITILNDGTTSIEEMFKSICMHFDLVD
ncbi:nucleoside/nucleotide kinase family protein [Anaeromicropila herbilytica]|uniref:Shikimate kinase n=1 Tax=Anaeromicropila herbilytica TaxID=2785025 RepID=A0A7R7EL88_9FIRM|nr:hypothetical protein [Anaeromicropila herbilytica]BCN30839.1 hypothetical protein bsdtb5_21340 [Anaeromicropila herbilytica]